jgi:hypothetical protein
VFCIGLPVVSFVLMFGVVLCKIWDVVFNVVANVCAC